MRIKVYLSDWFYNMGIVGFKRILEFQEVQGYLKLEEFNYVEKENYIEFDSDLLKDFHNYYFDYFLERYDMAKFQSKQINRLLNLCKKENKFKDYTENIKRNIKANNDKIKKIDKTIYLKADAIYKELIDIKKPEQVNDLENLMNKYQEILEIKSINDKITLNKFKSILSKSFFGQDSFFNVSHTGKTIDEQKVIMFKDYIQPIIEMSELKESINKGDYETIKNNTILKIKDKTLHKNVVSVYKAIKNKFIKSKKNIGETHDYLYSNDFILCQMCGEYKSIGNEYSEGNFLPLAVSTDNSRNMFWNFNTSEPLCDICKLILLCTAAGSTDIYKGYMDANLKSEDKQYFAFVNMDISVKELYKTNENFNLKKDKENPFKEVIFHIVSEAKNRSVWQLQNILYIEFNSDYKSKNCKMNYFNIPKFIAEFFRTRVENIEEIKDEKFKSEIIDNILNNVDIKYAIDKKIRLVLENNHLSSMDCYRAVAIRYYLNVYKGGSKRMSHEVDDKKLKFIYMRGVELNKYYVGSNSENKINSIAYRLLNSTKSNNRKEFMDTLIRIHLSAEKEVPSIFLDTMAEKELGFEEIAHSFIAGFISKASNKRENEGKKIEISPSNDK